MSPKEAGFSPHSTGFRQVVAIPSSLLIPGWALAVPWPQGMNGKDKGFLR